MAFHGYDDPPRSSSRRYAPSPLPPRDSVQYVESSRYMPEPRCTPCHPPGHLARPGSADCSAARDDGHTRPRAYGYRSRNPPSYRSEHRRMPTWPPPPSVEDVAEALAKEHNGSSLDGKRGEDAPNRGTVDQEPLMVQVEDEVARPDSDRRPVLVPGSDAGRRSDDVPIRKGPRAHADRQKAPPLQTDLDDPSVYTRRAPSPYAYSKPASAAKERCSGEFLLSPDVVPSSASRSRPGGKSRAHRLRPDPLRSESLFTSEPGHGNGVSDSSDLDADDAANLRSRRKPARYSFSPGDLKTDDLRTSLHDLQERVPSPYSFSPAGSKVDDLRSSSRDLGSATDRVSSPYSYSPADSKKEDLRFSLHDSEPAKERVPSPYSHTSAADLKRDNLKNTYRDPDPIRDGALHRLTPLSARPVTPPRSTPRSTPNDSVSSAGGTPSSQFFSNDLPWARSVPSRQGALETLYGSAKQRPSSKHSSRASSPPPGESKETKLPPSPPRSPRLRPQDDGVRVRAEPRSKQGSRMGSRAGSPLTGWIDSDPTPPSPRIELNSRPERVSTFPLSTSPKDHSTPPPRHIRYDSALREDPEPFLKDSPPRIDVRSPSSARPPLRSTNSLPYPDDDVPQLMPSEESFQYNHVIPRTPSKATSEYQRGSAVPQSPIPSRMRDDVEFSRTPIRRTASESSAQRDRTKPLLSREKKQISDSSPKDASPEMPELPLPPCPRLNYTARYDDWYTLEGSPSLDICPDCLNKIIGRSSFRRAFVRSRSSDPDRPKKCDFGSPWFRLAWLLTLKQKRQDLDLIESLASITDSEKDCPGSTEAVRIWYSLLNKYGEPITNFYVCQCDVRYLETLMPTLRGYFTPVDSSSKRLCSFCTTSRRFPGYLDTLLDIHEEALQRRRSPDLTPFIDLTTSHAWKRECQRDTLILNGLWHTIPGVPELTICEECYDDVVWPAVKAGSKLADDVTRTLQFVPGAAESEGRGNSCQLYSPRMRRVWARAARDGDLVSLARKVRERRRVETELQGQHRALRQLLEEQRRDKAAGHVGATYYSGGVSLPVVEPRRIREEMEKIQREWHDWE